MSIEADLVTELKATTAITAIVGTGNNARIYPGIATQGAAFPHIVWQWDHAPLQASSGPTGTVNSTCTLNLRAKTYAAMKALASAVKSDLDGWTNTAGTPSVSACRMVDESEDTEYASDDSDEIAHVTTQTYSLWYA